MYYNRDNAQKNGGQNKQNDEKLKALREDRDLTQENIADNTPRSKSKAHESENQEQKILSTKLIVYCRFVEKSTKLQCLLRT
jgi:DNA-binding XRE family transcriptional regulator